MARVRNRRVRKKAKIGSIDKKLLITILALTVVGLIAVADASAPIAIRDFGDKYYFFKQQLIWAIVGIVLMLFVTKLKFSFWEKIATPLFFLSILFLILVLIPGFGTKILGAKRWLNLGFFSFQPSELTKLSMALYQAKLAVGKKKISAHLIPIFVVSFLVMLQPDLGTTLVVVSFSMIQVFVAGVELVPLLGAVVASGVISLVLILTSGYRRERLMGFLEQTQDPLGKGYHIRQILLALGTGGLFGIGLGQSRQKYLFLPETATDSIFAVIAEEVGFLGATVLILAFVYLVIRSVKIAKSAPDRFSQIYSIGVASWIAGQTLLNIGSMVALVPLTGIPLPLISYGGSSLTTILVAVGILLSISRFSHEKK